LSSEPRGLDHLKIRLGQEVEAARRDAEPVSAQLDLGRRLLSGDVKHGPGERRQRAARLQQERGLADAGVAADQHQRAGDDTAAQHAVELADVGGDALA
jgi:hypothetical protein